MDKRAKILIVEDERIIALEMQNKLESLGYDVPANVSSGEEAIKKAEELSPDLVLMDIILHGEMDGVEAADQIRTRFNIPVVYVTANVSDARLEDIKRTEPFGCLFKPFDDMELHAAIEMALYKYKMEKKLWESEENYRSVVENSHDGILVVGEDYRFAYVNDMFCQIVGYSRSEIIGQDFTKFVDEKSKRLVADRYKQRQAGEKLPPRYDFNIVRKDGTKRRVEISSTVSKDPKGRVRTIAQILDITERKQTEKALQESEEKYRNLFEKSEDAILIIHNGKVVDCNQATIKMLRYNKKDELLNMHPSELSPEKQPNGKRSFTKANEIMKIAFKYGTHRFEWYHKKSDGEIFPVEVSMTAISDDEKNQILHTVWRDITDRKEAEKALQKSEEKFRTIIESMEDGYYEVDLAGRFTFFNEAMLRITGFPADELMGMSNLEYTDPGTAKNIYKTFNEVYRTGNPAEVADYEVIIKGGSKRVLEFNVSLMRDEEGEPVGFRGIVRDVTQRKKAEEEAEASREHIALVNKILRHDLTNDLVVIQSALNLYSKSPEEELLQEISSHSEKSLNLIKRMRELEFFMSRHRKLQRCEMRDAIDEVIKNYPSINFEIKGKAQVMADDSLSSVIDNIIRNAVIHGKADRIAITIGKATGRCEVRIADNGSGIPDEIKAKVFEEGFTHGDTGHTGLGLHIVEKAMKAYGGHAYTEDNEPKGAIFVLRFRMVK